MFHRIRNLLGRSTKKKANYPTPLPSHISDNQYLASSAHAGLIDRETGAYDKYLFEDKEIPEMPYEAAVDNHLGLMSERLSQRFTRHISRAQIQKIRAERTLKSETLKQGHIEELNASAVAELQKQTLVLSGEKPGKQSLYWPGEVPALFSIVAARIKLASRYLVFLAVAGIDLFIIYLSLNNLNIGVVESALLTAPAVGAQLIFPHLAGVRLSYLVRGMHKRISVWIELIVLLGIWFAFIYVMTNVRVQFIVNQIRQNEGITAPEQIAAFYVLNAVLLLALGGWLIFLAIRENPHEIEALRAQLKIRAMAKRVLRSNSHIAKAKKRLDEAEEALAALQTELDTAVNSTRTDLAEAAKSVYRRALINEMGDPEFTRSYYSEGADSAKGD